MRRRTALRKSGIVLALAAALLVALVGGVAFQLFAPRKLRYRWREGRALTYEIASQATVHAQTEFSDEALADKLSQMLDKIAGQRRGATGQWLKQLENLSAEVTHRCTVTLRPREVTAAGATLEATVERLEFRLTPRAPDSAAQVPAAAVAITWDGQQASVTAPPGRWLGGLSSQRIAEELKRPFRLSVSPRGEANEAQLGAWAALVALLSGFPQEGLADVFFVLPEQAVRGGDSWSAKFAPEKALPTPLRAIVSARQGAICQSRLTSLRLRALHRMAEIEYTCRYDGELAPNLLGIGLFGPMRTELAIAAEGRGTFDATAGRLLASEQRQTLALRLKLDLSAAAGAAQDGSASVQFTLDGQRTVTLVRSE